MNIRDDDNSEERAEESQSENLGSRFSRSELSRYFIDRDFTDCCWSKEPRDTHDSLETSMKRCVGRGWAIEHDV